MENHGQVRGLGVQQEVNPGRQRYAQQELDEHYAYHVKAHTHLWIVMLTHRGSDQMLDALDDPDPTAMPILDVETMIGGPVVVCYVCEVAYEPRLRRRKCPGDPNPGVKG